MIIQRVSMPSIRRSARPALITTNCAVLGVALPQYQLKYDFGIGHT